MGVGPRNIFQSALSSTLQDNRRRNESPSYLTQTKREGQLGLNKAGIKKVVTEARGTGEDSPKTSRGTVGDPLETGRGTGEGSLKTGPVVVQPGLEEGRVWTAGETCLVMGKSGWQHASVTKVREIFLAFLL